MATVFGIVGSRADEVLDGSVEAFVGMMDEDVSGLNGGEDRAVQRAQGGTSGVHGGSRSSGNGKPGDFEECSVVDFPV